MTEAPPKKGRKDWSEMSAGERIIGVVGLIVIVAVIVTIVIPGIQHWANASPAPTQEAAVAAPTRTTSPTRAPSPTPETAWPAEFRDRFCSALGAMAIMNDDLIELGEAGAAMDLQRSSDLAWSTSSQAEVIVALLDQAPDWAPARDLVAQLRAAMETYQSALSDVDRGVTSTNASLIQRGTQALPVAAQQVAAARQTLTQLQGETGFTCER